MNNKDRFLILRDRTVYLPALGVNGANPSANNYAICDVSQQSKNGNFIYEEYIKLHGLESHYKASTGGIGDISTGAFLLVCIAQDSNGTPAWELFFSARFNFTD